MMYWIQGDKRLLEKITDVLKTALVGRTVEVFGPEKGLWGKHSKPMELEITDVVAVYADPDSDYANIDIVLDGYDAKRHGLIYSDPSFLREIRKLLYLAGLDESSLRYSEHGMQGRRAVNMDVKPSYLLKPRN